MDLLRHLALFRRVADCGSFSRAAELEGIAPSSLSAAIRQLERHLGTSLFQRTTRRVRLSSDGGLLYARSAGLLAEADAVAQLFRAGDGLAGLLRVEVPARMARRLLAPALPGFLAAHPGVAIDLGGSDRISDPVGDGIDCVLRVGPLGDVDLVARPLGRLRQASCAAPALLQRHDPVVDLDAIAALPAVQFGQGAPGRAEDWEFDTADGIVVRPMRGRVRVGNAETYIACALAGLGAIQVPRYDIADLLDAGRLVELLPATPPPALPVTVLYPAPQRGSRLLQVFVDWLAAQLAPFVEDGSAP
ncbi:LysR family transcriptional regulator [Luteimonas sp. BDR2-5]|uniref:LysR family transcriptional regulator n=1 Tax=Proluteimonas luteida TaxID=2878685 RepID=UPI001E501F0D|nr:LysR family transcriptional regulator [Luteimonas sp. BDR2-5]MCD9030107.1 LysR family transcriptional regulator [Luteimonas sp. BDR2-5]